MNMISRYTLYILLTCYPNIHAFGSLPDEDQVQGEVLEEIVVTGSVRVTAGGSQDVNFARARIARGEIPHPEDMTVEGLLSEYDLALPGKGYCGQLFCLQTEALRSEHTLFAGLGFASNIDASRWQRPAANIIAVVDRSGSMDGAPLAMVRHALHTLADTLGPDDRLAIVVYGDGAITMLPSTSLQTAHLPIIRRTIDRIESQGSTNMEAGLQLGYQLARQSAAEFAATNQGRSRVLLFTDERPNVGRTDADSFMTMARTASLEGIGLTTLGVATHFDAALATTIASVRGGNLFFLDNRSTVARVFGTELDFMLAELAYDIQITVQPNPGWRIAGIYGVPAQLLHPADEGGVTFAVPTVFLSNRGGGIYVALTPAAAPSHLPASHDEVFFADIDMTYREALTGIQGEAYTRISRITRRPSAQLRAAQMLIDVYKLREKASYAHHVSNDQNAAYRAALEAKHVLHNALTTLPRNLQRKFSREKRTSGALVQSLARRAGLAGEGKSGNQRRVWGTWKVVHAEANNWLDLEDGEIIHFGPDRILRDVSIASPDWSNADALLYERHRVYFVADEIGARVRLHNNLLQLALEDETRVRLRRVRFPTQEELP
ncbi:MAG: VWA domain-containing protein [Pseudomonadota bacterium]